MKGLGRLKEKVNRAEQTALLSGCTVAVRPLVGRAWSATRGLAAGRPVEGGDSVTDEREDSVWQPVACKAVLVRRGSGVILSPESDR